MRLSPVILALAPLFFVACGTGSSGESDDALIAESASLAISSGDPAVDQNTENAEAGMTPEADMADENIDATTGDTPDESAVSCDFSEMRARILQRFDADGDGVLSPSERAALRDEIDAHPRARVIVRRLLGADRRPHFHVFERVRWAFDTDDDGQLSDDERAAMVAALEARCERRKAAMLERYDANGDGRLDRTELAQALADARQAFEAKKAELLARYDANNDGVLDEAERAAVRADIEARIEALREHVRTQFDTNGDGQLDQAERDALKAAIRDRIENGPSMPNG